MTRPASEFRRDPYSGEWVTIAGSRQSRPALPESCPFCIGGLEAPDAYSVKAFTNRWPVMRPMSVITSEREDHLGRAPSELLDELRLPPAAMFGAGGEARGIHESAPAVGDAEVILYTPEHEGSLGGLHPEQFEKVWNLWVERTAALAGRSEISSVLVFENRGEEVGVTIHHPHGQIYAFPFVPPRQRTELERAGTRAGAGGACVTCDVAETEAGGPRSLLATDSVVAYVPFASAWPYAAHVTTRRHVGSIGELSVEEGAAMREVLSRVLVAGDRIFGRPLPTMMALLQRPFDGSDHGGLWHFRIEIVSPLRKRSTLRFVAAAEVSSGTYANPVTPEDAADAWRSAVEVDS